MLPFAGTYVISLFVLCLKRKSRAVSSFAGAFRAFLFFYRNFCFTFFAAAAPRHHNLLKCDEQKNQETCDDLAPPGGKCAIESNQAGNHCLQQNAEESAYHVANAAGQ